MTLSRGHTGRVRRSEPGLLNGARRVLQLCCGPHCSVTNGCGARASQRSLEPVSPALPGCPSSSGCGELFSLSRGHSGRVGRAGPHRLEAAHRELQFCCGPHCSVTNGCGARASQRSLEPVSPALPGCPSSSGCGERFSLSRGHTGRVRRSRTALTGSGSSRATILVRTTLLCHQRLRS